MRRALLGFGLALLSGCADGLVTISLDVEDTTVVEGGGILSELIGSLGFDGFAEMNLVASQELQNQGVEPGDIEEVRLTLIELTAASPDDADLSFLSEMQVSVQGPDLPEIPVAFQDSFPEGQRTVTLSLEDAELSAYVVSESMTFTTDVTGSPPVDDTEVHALISLDVRVTAQGVVNQVRSDDQSE